MQQDGKQSGNLQEVPCTPAGPRNDVCWSISNAQLQYMCHKVLWHNNSFELEDIQTQDELGRCRSPVNKGACDHSSTP